MKKKILNTLITMMVVMSFSSFIFVGYNNAKAETNNNLKIESEINQQNVKDSIYDFDQNINNENKSGKFIPKHDFLKVSFENKSGSSVNISIQTANGNTILDGEFEADATLKGYSEIMLVNANSEYRYVVNCPNEDDIDGRLIIESIDKNENISKGNEGLSCDFNENITIETRNSKVTPKYDFLKASFENKSDKAVDVFIQTKNGTTTLDTFTVEPNSKGYSKILNVNGGTKYNCTVNCSGETIANIDGKLIIESSDEENKLK